MYPQSHPQLDLLLVSIDRFIYGPYILKKTQLQIIHAKMKPWIPPIFLCSYSKFATPLFAAE